MRNYTKYLPIIYIGFLSALLFCFLTHYASARGGGGGSGGGGGGGSFGGSGGGSGTGNNIIYYSVLLFFVTIGLIYSWYSRRKKISNTREIISEAEEKDTAWKISFLDGIVRDLFIKFQKDWSNNNAEAMKEYCTPKFQEKMSLELSVLKFQNRKNLVTAPNLKSIVIIDANDDIDNERDSFTAEIRAQAEDQLIDTTTNSILMTEREPFKEYWNFLRDGNNWKINAIRQSTENKLLTENSIILFAERNNFFYDPDFGWLMMPNKGVIFKRSNFKTSDINNHVIGMFRGKIVEFYTFMPRGRSNLNYMVAQTTLPVKYNDILVRRKRWFWNFSPFGLRRIHTESNDFNNKFCLYAHRDDQINSFVLLAPDFMEEIYNLPFELNIEIVGNFLYLYVKRRKNINEDEMMKLLSRAFDSMRSG